MKHTNVEIAIHGVCPEALYLGDLTAILTEFNKVLKEYGGQVKPALVGIRRGSAVQEVAVDPEVAEELYNDACEPAEGSRLAKFMSDLRRRSVSSGWQGATLRVRGREVTLTRELPDRPSITGTATVYGQLFQVGGLHETVAKIQTEHGEKISIHLTKDQVHELAHLIYQVVGVRGLASWSTDFRVLAIVRLFEVLPYRQTTTKKALLSLENSVSWVEGFDPDEYSRELHDD